MQVVVEKERWMSWDVQSRLRSELELELKDAIGPTDI